MTATTDRWYAFRAANAETLYGWGAEAEADAYVARLNAGREVNHYHAAPVEDAALVAELDADSRAGGSRGIVLEEQEEEESEDRTRLSAAIEASGLSARRFADAVLAVDERTVRYWLAEDRAVPGPVRVICAAIVADPSVALILSAARATLDGTDD